MNRCGLALFLLAVLAAPGCGALNPGSELPAMDFERVHSGAEALDFDPSSAWLVSGGWDGEVALWRPGQAAPLLRFAAHEGFVQGIAFAGDHIVTAGVDGRLKLWDRDGKLAAERDTGAPIDKMVVMGDRVVSAHRDGALRLWRLPEFHLQRAVSLHRGSVASLAGSARSGRIASGGYDGDVFLLEDGRTPRRLPAPPTDARSLAFSPDGDTLYGGGWFKLFRWSLPQGRLDIFATAHWGVISSLEYAPDARAIASISRVNDSALLFLDPDSGKTLRHLRRHPVCGTALALSPDGRYLANTGDDGVIRIFDLDQ